MKSALLLLATVPCWSSLRISAPVRVPATIASAGVSPQNTISASSVCTPDPTSPLASVPTPRIMPASCTRLLLRHWIPNMSLGPAPPPRPPRPPRPPIRQLVPQPLDLTRRKGVAHPGDLGFGLRRRQHSARQV